MIEFKQDDDGTYWVAVSGNTGEEIIRSPSYPKKKETARHLGRVRGCFRDEAAILKWTKQMTEGLDGTGPIEAAVRDHAAAYAVGAALEILRGVEPTQLTQEAIVMLLDLSTRDDEKASN